MKNHNIIFYYHVIGNSRMSVQINDFEDIVHKLSSDYKLVTVSDLIKRHFVEHKTEGYCAISFDDYFQDTHCNTIPIFKKYDIKATFYVSIDYINKVLWGSEKLDKWSEKKDDNYDIPFKMMTWENINELITNNHEVGAHTLSHPNLTDCSYEDTFEEIYKSKEILEKKLDVSVKSFAYPRGIFDKREKNIVKDIGFENGVTTIKDFVTKSQDIFSVTRMPGPLSAKHLEYLLSGKIQKFKIKITNGLKSRYNKFF